MIQGWKNGFLLQSIFPLFYTQHFYTYILKPGLGKMILDEPINGLDIESTRILRMILLKLKDQGKTIIITSHIIETLTNLCDSIHFLEEGKIKFSKTRSEFAAFEKMIFQPIE